MGKNPTLTNIYLKIHNKRTLYLDDLRYLAKYSPECFEKTCQNVIYNMPESKPLMEPRAESAPLQSPASDTKQTPDTATHEWDNINQILNNIKQLEAQDFPLSTIDIEQVKSLLGDLYMEQLFPHNDKASFFQTDSSEETSTFDRKA